MFGNFEDFATSTVGQVIIVGLMIVFFAVILLTGKKGDKTFDVSAMTISALLIAIAYVLSMIRLFRMPQGGSVTPLSWLPIALCAYMLGTRKGVLAGMVLGLLNLLFGGYVIHPVQMILDYPLAFGAMGLGGVARDAAKHPLLKVYLIGAFGRYVCAVISGVVFFGSYAPEGFSALTWSVWYNFTYLAAECLITTIVLCIPAVRTNLEMLRVRYGE